MGRHKREMAYAVLLRGKNVLGIEKVSSGSEGLVDSPPDEVYRTALERDCRSVILVHNHPSGKAEPSWQDRTASRNLYGWGRNIGIELRDSVIIDGKNY